MSTQTRLTIPMDKDLRAQLKERAAQLGFDSSQALLRYVSKAIVDHRKVNFGTDDWGEPTPEAAARLNKWAAEAVRESKAGKLKSYTSADDFMKDLVADEADPTQ